MDVRYIPEQIVKTCYDCPYYEFVDGGNGCNHKLNYGWLQSETIKEAVDRNCPLPKKVSSMYTASTTSDLASWTLYPDRMGGQFTDEEINRSQSWI